MKRAPPSLVTFGIVAAGAAGLAGLLYWQLQRLFTEQQAYRVEGRMGPLEVRVYPAAVRAETRVEASDWREALNLGFKRLAGYVFGGNRPRQDFALSAPVRMEPERLAMTAPVAQTATESGPWTMAFTMPVGRGLESLPHPKDARVHLTQVPARRVAVLRFSGSTSTSRVHERKHQLLALLAHWSIPTVGPVEFAGYDPPTTLPLLRRNEVWIELEG